MAFEGNGQPVVTIEDDNNNEDLVIIAKDIILQPFLRGDEDHNAQITAIGKGTLTGTIVVGDGGD